MGQTCSKKTNDVQHEVGIDLNSAQPHQQMDGKPYKSVRFNDEPMFEYEKQNNNRLFGSRSNGKFGSEMRNPNFDDFDDRSFGRGSELRGSRLDGQRSNRNIEPFYEEQYEMRSNLLPKDMSYQMSTVNKMPNFYDDGFEEAHVLNDGRSQISLRLNDERHNSGRKTRIFDDGNRSNQYRSSIKPEREDINNNGSQINDMARSSNIFLAEASEFNRKKTLEDNNQMKNQGFNSQVKHNPSNIDKTTFKHFLDDDSFSVDPRLLKTKKYQSQVPARPNDNLQNKHSNIKIDMRSEINANKMVNQYTDPHKNHKSAINGQYMPLNYPNNDLQNNNPQDIAYNYSNNDFNNFNSQHLPNNYPNNDFSNVNYQGMPSNINRQPYESEFRSNISGHQPDIKGNFNGPNDQQYPQSYINPGQLGSNIDIMQQRKGPQSEFMRLSHYQNPNTYDIKPEPIDPTISNMKNKSGLRDSNSNFKSDSHSKLPDGGKHKSKLAPIKEESHIEHDDKHIHLRLPNGNTYMGEVKGNLPHGRGKEIFINGDVYTGDFFEGKRHGDGTYEKRDEFIYVGSFKNNKFEGKGKKLFINGNKFEGLFKNGKEEGTGVLRDAQDNLIQHGMWIDGEYTKL